MTKTMKHPKDRTTRVRITDQAGGGAVYVTAMRYVELELDAETGPPVTIRLSLPDARRVAAHLMNAADDLDAGRGST